MESSSSTPSASSHASSIVRAALRTPIPSPATPSPARCAGAYEITSPNSAWDEAITSPAPPPKYHLYGLANSESSVADDQAEPTTKHAEPTALPTVPVQNTEDLDLFGPTQPQVIAAVQCHKRRRADAVLTMHVKRVRTTEWVQEIRRDISWRVED
ncbi:hypothetical protein B0H13DRAFT_2451231 [Mycena leptocephala]|nr:hypothetical protein B0H13DRAFT_2146152 [Mycena leptocephala]KAJ7916031.1 hypothetical protein B0H13DRAFT_2658498 [Mycena leptocephala]KAJ7916060.1 hypothetical protein B0H13DRAFT_2451231 [Mycena leptocephala]